MSNQTFTKQTLSELSIGDTFYFTARPESNQYVIVDTNSQNGDTEHTCINTQYGTTIKIPNASCISVFVKIQS